MRRAALLAVLLLPLVAAGPNAREDTLDAQGSIQELAVSWNGASIGVATEDPSGGVGGQTAPVWYLWEADGSQVWARDADRSGCATSVEDDCESHAVTFSLSDDGTKFALASEVEPLTITATDPSRSLVLLGTGAQGVIAQYKSEWPVDFVRVSGDGSRVVVISHDPAAAATQSKLQVFMWPSPNLADAAVETTFPGRVSDLSVSVDGKEIALAADAYRHLSGAGQKTDTTSSETQTPKAVHVTRDGDWTVVGYAKGTIALYPKSASGISKAPLFSRQPGSADVSSVAATPDGSWYAAGDAQGRIHFFEIHQPTGGVPARYTLSVPVSASPVRDLVFSENGEYLAYYTGGEVHFGRWNGKVLTNVWKDERAATGLAMDATGDLLAASVGSSVVIYDALHFVAGVAPVSPAEPGVTTTVTVTYRNDGNRAEDVTLQPSAPAGWTITPKMTAFALEPGATKTVDVDVELPDGTPQGTHSIRLNHTLASGNQGFTVMDFEVPLVERLILQTVGAPSVNTDPGAEVTFDVLLRNAGNAARNGTLSVTTPDARWSASVSPSSYTLGPGKSMPAVVKLKAPVGLQDGEGTTITVSTANVGVNLTAIAGAFFDFTLIAPGGVEGSLGNVTRFDVAIENLGNAPDTYTIMSGPLPAGWNVLFENGHSEFDFQGVQPGNKVTTIVTVAIGEEAEVGARHALDIMAVSKSNPEETRKRTVIVTVGEPVGDLCEDGFTYQDGECVKERGIPAPGIAALVAGLALVAWRRR